MGMKLPTEDSEVVTDIGKSTMLLYGPPKHGKSTIVSSFPGVLFAAAEEGLNHIKCRKVGIGKWEDFEELAELLITDKHDYRTLAIDTASALFAMCEEYTCKKLGIDHPSDENWGKGWKALRGNFHNPIRKLAVPMKSGKTRIGLVFVGHDKQVEVKGRITKTSRTACDLSGTARKVLLPLVDIIGYCGFRLDASGEATQERVVHFKGSETVEAGDRTSKLPDWVTMTKERWYTDKLQPAFDHAEELAPVRRPKKLLA